MCLCFFVVPAGAEQCYIWFPGVQCQSRYHHYSPEVRRSLISPVRWSNQIRLSTHTEIKYSDNLMIIHFFYCFFFSAVASKTKTSCFIMKWVKSRCCRLLDIILYYFKFELKFLLPFISVPSICYKWNWKSGRPQPERARSWFVWKFKPCYSLQYLFTTGLHSKHYVQRLSGWTVCVCVCVSQGPWLKRLWDQSFLKTSRSPSGSVLRCWSPMVSLMAQFFLIQLLSSRGIYLKVCLFSTSLFQDPLQWPQHVEAASH